MADQQGTRAPGETVGGGVYEFNANSGDIRVLMLKLGAMDNKIDRLIEDRKEDKQKIEQAVETVRQDFKEFKKEDFRPLQGDVSNLRIKWAWVTGVGAVIGVAMSLLVEIAKSPIK